MKTTTKNCDLAPFTFALICLYSIAVTTFLLPLFLAMFIAMLTGKIARNSWTTNRAKRLDT